MKYRFNYSEEKDLILREVRGISFEDAIEAINEGNVLDDIDHFNKKRYPNQRIFILRIRDKVYAVPYVLDKIRAIIFLKTIYPNRDLKKIYLKKHEQKAK